MIGLVLALGCAVVLYVLVHGWVRRRRASLGMDQFGVGHGNWRNLLTGFERKTELVAADDSRLGARNLRSERLGLVGRPDHLLRVGRVVIPVEHKPKAQRLQASHILQVAAQCLLVEEVYGSRPPYGVVVLSGGTQERVAFTPQLEHQLLDTMDCMRELLVTGREPGRAWIRHKCRACGFHQVCWS